MLIYYVLIFLKAEKIIPLHFNNIKPLNLLYLKVLYLINLSFYEKEKDTLYVRFSEPNYDAS